MPAQKKEFEQISIPPNYYSNLEIIANSVSAGLSIIDESMSIVWHNKFHEAWFGKLCDVKGRHCYEIYEKRRKVCVGCPVRKIFKHGYERCMAIRRGIPTCFLGKRCFKITASPIRDEKGKVTKVLELVEDVTDERKAEGVIKKKLNIVTKELDLITKLDKEFISLQELSLDRVLQQVVEIAKVLLNSRICNLRLIDVAQKSLISKAGSGLNNKEMGAIEIGKGVTGKVGELKRPVLVGDLKNSKYFPSEEYDNKNKFRSVLSVPILLKNEVLGTLTIYDKRIAAFTKEDSNLLLCFANHAAILIDNITAHKEVFSSYLDTIKSLVAAIETRDVYMRGHSEKVTKFALEIAGAMGLSEDSKSLLAYCGRLHDIGKIGVSDSILKKPGPLTDGEWSEMRLHPVKAVQMLSDLKFLRKAIPAIRHHHERYDGTGYPDGLKGKEIPLFARVLACADSFDAMTSDRAYKPRMSIKEALTEIEINKGTQFDPEIADLFIDMIKTRGIS